MKTFKQFLASPELIDLRKTKQVWKSTVAAGKKPRTELGVLGISIGQTQSSGDTSRVTSEAIAYRIGRTDKVEPIEQHIRTPKSIRVAELIRKVKLSDLSEDDVQNIISALLVKRPRDVLDVRDIEQLAVIANVDPVNLRKLAGV